MTREERILRWRERAQTREDTVPRGLRLRLVGESYGQSEGEPAVLRRAKALAHYLRHVPIALFPEDRLAGQPQRLVLCHRGLNEKLGLGWVRNVDFPEVHGGALGDDEGLPHELRPLLESWRGFRTIGQARAEQLSPEAKKLMRAGVFHANGLVMGHNVPGFERVFRLGLAGIRREAEEALARLGGDRRAAEFLQATIICCNAAAEFARRHAELAERLAEEADDPALRESYLEVAATCRRVPEHPARTFREALQALWFVHRLVEVEFGDATAVANSLGRIDQYLWPYYVADISAGRLSKDEARELLEELYFKLSRLYADQHTLVGGVGRNGADATNELSHLWLEIALEHRLLVAVGARVHRNSPESFWELCAEVSARNIGFALFNDEVIIPALCEHGIPEEAAREYCIVGCVEHVIPRVAAPRTMEFSLNLAKCLELALHNGRCALSGEQVGPQTGDAARFCTFDELLRAYHAQVAHAVNCAVEAVHAGQKLQREFLPCPFLSATLDHCVARGRDVTEGGQPLNPAGVCIVGVANVADALAALREVVFAKKRATMAEVVSALRADFCGYETLRAMLRNAPKFGNDDRRADELAREVAERYLDELAGYRTLFGDRFLPLLFGVTNAAVRQWGRKTGALPDGRRAGEPLAVSANPTQSYARRGPTAAARSVCALPCARFAGGMSYIVDLQPSDFAGEEGRAKLVAFIKAYFDMGGMNIGVNVIDAQTLRAAQREPERYASLSVRIFGYSDYFVALDRDVQEYLIARAEQAG